MVGEDIVLRTVNALSKMRVNTNKNNGAMQFENLELSHSHLGLMVHIWAAHLRNTPFAIGCMRKENPWCSDRKTD